MRDNTLQEGRQEHVTMRVYQEAVPKIRGFFAKLKLDDVEDLEQEVAYRFFMKIDRYSNAAPEHIRGALWKIAHFVRLERYRKLKRKYEPIAEDFDDNPERHGQGFDVATIGEDVINRSEEIWPSGDTNVAFEN